MSRRTEKRRYGKYNKFDVVYADFGKNPHGIQGGIRPGIIISCDASNHDGAPQVSVVPLSSKLKDIPVHVILNPKDVSGFGLSRYLILCLKMHRQFQKAALEQKVELSLRIPA